MERSFTLQLDETSCQMERDHGLQVKKLQQQLTILKEEKDEGERQNEEQMKRKLEQAVSRATQEAEDNAEHKIRNAEK